MDNCVYRNLKAIKREGKLKQFFLQIKEKDPIIEKLIRLSKYEEGYNLLYMMGVLVDNKDTMYVIYKEIINGY
jgi:hypothetical protein